MATRIQLRRGLSTEWSNINPVLSNGEAGIESDTNKLKIGNGYSSWNDLPYFLQEKVFGSQYQYFEDDAQFSYNGSQNITVSSFETSELPSGTYRVNLQWNFTMNTTSNSVYFEMYVNNTLSNSPIQIEIKDSSDDITHSLFQNIELSSGTHTIELRTRTENSSYVTVRVVKCDLWRVE